MPVSARMASNAQGALRHPAVFLRLCHGPRPLRMRALHSPYHAHQFHNPGRKALHSSAATSYESTVSSALAKNTPETRPRETIRLTGAEEMLLPVVFVKAEDAKYDQPILGDPFSQCLLDRCDIDYSKTHFTRDCRFVKWVSSRARTFDNWCQEFLDAYQGQPVTVLHIACGLDCRALRVKRGPNVRWIDADLSLVVDLRRRLIPQPPGDYVLRALEVTKEGWLSDIPADRPTLVIAEGLSMYLEPAEGEQVIKDVTGHFGRGEIVLDTLGSLSTRFTSAIKLLQSSGSAFKWGIDDPRKQVETLDPKLRLKEQVVWGDILESHPPIFGELATSLASLFPRFKYNMQLLRFSY